jgi:hypothetical protein
MLGWRSGGVDRVRPSVTVYPKFTQKHYFALFCTVDCNRVEFKYGNGDG